MQEFSISVANMRFPPSNIANDINGDERESIVDESDSLIAASISVDYASIKAVAVVCSDEEAQCFPHEQPQQELPRNIAGVISILLLGTDIL